MRNQFTWVDYYTELADKLLGYKNDRAALIEVIKTVYENIGFSLPKLDKGEVTDIDPFTVFALFNKGITKENRQKILGGFSKQLSINIGVPDDFDGIPVVNNRQATFYWFEGDRGADDINNLWLLFEAALEYSKEANDETKAEFIKSFDTVVKQKGIKWNITMGLFWVRPDTFINLDENNRKYITAKFSNAFGDGVRGKEYVEIITSLQEKLEDGSYGLRNFPELSYAAWIQSKSGKSDSGAAPSTVETVTEESAEASAETVRYWMYAPGHNASRWEDFYKEQKIAIGWGELGDLTAYSSKEEMRLKIKEIYDDSNGCTNSALANWQFSKEMKPGDIVFAKRGMYTIIGCGVVTGEYEYVSNAINDYNHVRKINWTHKGEWGLPEGLSVKTLPMKTLTDVTRYSELIEKLLDLIEAPEETVITEKEDDSAYTRDNFLEEVYVDGSEYDTIVKKLEHKKNIILQGPPGVGKTFAAKRLAYSIMGEMDDSRIKLVQFHQSYGYEDFIMGYRPNEKSFELIEGPFYQFCEAARKDISRKYYFIIDEINRGNLSKIFGELFVLIEGDKRGKMSVRLLYRDEEFTVPSNVYIIGMMNTADRSLAIMDFALRRRFAFFEFKPAFSSEGFINDKLTNATDKFKRVIQVIEELNNTITEDDSLGRGFCIGHSYFCTSESDTDEGLKSVIDFEILPLIEEYWFDEPSKYLTWANKLNEAMK